MANSNEGIQGRYWHESSVMVFVAPRNLSQARCTDRTDNNWQDYQVLMMKRSQKSSFMPNVHVFPGGVVNPVDYNRRWAYLYQRVTGLSMDNIGKQLHITGDRPAMITKPFTEIDTVSMPPDLCFRITAIREAFEESGILMLCTVAGIKDRDSPYNIPVKDTVIFSDELNVWRGKVNKNPDCFIDLCETLQMVPDVWSLVEWSNWLTPVFLQVDSPPPRPKRYDTLYYMCFLQKTQDASADQNEIVSSKHQWLSPLEFLKLGEKKKAAFLGPPPYELGRMSNFSSYEGIKKFAIESEKCGTQRVLGVGYLLQDGYVSIQPGDSLYPWEPDLTGRKGIQTLNSTVQDLADQSGPKHRKFRPHEGFEFT